MKLVSVFGKTTETCEQTVRMCGKTRWPFARTGEEIGMISEQIDRIGIRIGRV